MLKWRNEYRRCDNCRIEYRPVREAQSYCSRRCKRAAAYGRERFRAGTKGRRRRRLEASDKLAGMVVAGSVRSGAFSSIETGGCSSTDWIDKLNQAAANEVDRAYWTGKKRKWALDLMGGARHSARQPAFKVEPKLRQSVVRTEWLLNEDESPATPYWATTSNLNATRTVILSYLNVWTGERSQFWPRLHELSRRRPSRSRYSSVEL